MQNPENLAKNLVNPVSAAGIYPKKITTVILTAYKTPPSLCAEVLLSTKDCPKDY